MVRFFQFSEPLQVYNIWWAKCFKDAHSACSPTHFWIIFCQGQQQKKLENGEFVTLEDLIISIVCKNVFVVRTMHNGTIRFQYWPYFEIRFAILDLLTQHSLWACRQSAKYFIFKTKWRISRIFIKYVESVLVCFCQDCMASTFCWVSRYVVKLWRVYFCTPVFQYLTKTYTAFLIGLLPCWHSVI